VANLRNIFRNIMAAAFSPELLAATHPPRKNTRFAARKIARTFVASSLPQDSQVQLMFGAARFGEPALSASRSLGFHIVPRRARPPHRLDNPRKCFNQRRILDQTKRRASSCGLSACSGALFRVSRRAGGRGLPLVCRKAPEVRRKTRGFKSVRTPSAAPCSLSPSTGIQFAFRRIPFRCG
jgi:hypothetical protein